MRKSEGVHCPGSKRLPSRRLVSDSEPTADDGNRIGFVHRGSGAEGIVCLYSVVFFAIAGVAIAATAVTAPLNLPLTPFFIPKSGTGRTVRQTPRSR